MKGEVETWDARRHGEDRGGEEGEED